MNRFSLLTSRALPIVGLLSFLAAGQLSAQCGIVFANNPSTATVVLSNTTPGMGTATFSDLNAIALGISPTGGGCNLEFDDDPMFPSPSPSETFDCSDLGVQTIYVRSNDGTFPPNPNGVSPQYVTINITVVDDADPTATCPANASATTNPSNACSAAVGGLGVSVLDNCTVTSVTNDFNGMSNVSGAAFPQGTTTVKYTITDQSGNTGTCTFTVTITDNDPPTVTCPANLTVNTDPNQCYATFPSLLPAALFDNCALGSPDHQYRINPPGAFINGPIPSTQQFAVGTSTVQFRARAAVVPVNSTNCSFTVTVQDTQKPAFGGAFNNGSSHNLSTGTGANANDCIGRESITYPSVSDNCGILSYQYSYSGATVLALTNANTAGGTLANQDFNLGATTVTFTVTDVNMNTTSASWVITVVDDVAPTMPAYAVDVTVNVDPGACNKAVTFTRPSLLANPVMDCGTVTITQGTPTLNGNNNAGLLAGTPAYNQNVADNITTTYPVGVNEIPYTWSDGVNSFTINVKVTVNEPEPPVPDCKPGPLSFFLDQTGNVNLTTSDVNNASSDNCGIASMTISPSNYTCNDIAAPADITLTVEDFAGNVSTCSRQVNIVDNIVPILTCPGNVFVNADANCEASNIAPGGVFVAVENCSLNPSVLLYSIDGGNNWFDINLDFPTQIFPLGNTTVSVYVEDVAGNPAFCNFNVNVDDNTAPTPTAALISATSNVSGSVNLGGCLGSATWTNPAILFDDNCPSAVIITQSHSSPAILSVGTHVVTYTAIDPAGNIGTHTFNIVMTDTQFPAAACKPNYDVFLAAGSNPSVTILLSDIDNGSADNCFLTTLAHAPTVLNCSNLGQNVITLTASDGTNTSTCTTVVTVKDQVLPTATCQNATINLDAMGNATLTTAQINNGSTDNCTVQNVSLSKTTFDCSNLGTNTVTLTVTDQSNNMATCTATVTVADNIPPTAAAPADVTIECWQLPYTSLPVTASNNCGTPTISAPTDTDAAGNCANAKTITRKWTVSDSQNNSIIVTQTITVRDTKAPYFKTINPIVKELTTSNCTIAVSELDLQANNLVSDSCSSFANLTIRMGIDYPSGTDIPNSTAYSTTNLQNFPIGISTVTFTATDQCGNTSTKTATVEVKDKKGPDFSIFPAPHNPFCGQNFVLTNTPGNCSNIFTWHRPNSDALFNQPVNLGGDGSPDITDCSGGVSVTETIANAGTGGATLASNLAASIPGFNYNANPLVQPTVVTPTAQIPVTAQPFVFTYIATDGAGNSSSCSFSIKVNDSQAPTLVCPATQTLNTTCPDGQVPNFTSLASVNDNCPASVTLTQSPAAGTLLNQIAGLTLTPGSTFTVTLTGTDIGNSGTCSFLVQLADGDDPIPTVPSLPAITSQCGSVNVLAPTANDPCNAGATTIYGTPSAQVGSLVSTNPPTYNFLPGNYVITWIYNDGNGNISSQTQTVAVLPDTFPPTALCQSGIIGVPLQADGDTLITPVIINNGSFDQTGCDATSALTLSIQGNAVLNCARLNDTVTMTLVVTDTHGNSKTCTAKVDVFDNSAPVFTTSSVPKDTILAACQTIPAPGSPVATDACDASLAITYSADTTSTHTDACKKYDFKIVRKWVAKDDAGNTTSVTQTITVDDTTPPAFNNAPNNQVIFTRPGRTTCDDTVKIDLRPFVTDCATGADLTITPSNGNLTGVYSVGVHAITVVATDACGNSRTRTQSFEVKDGTAPTAVCINGISTTLNQAGTVSITANMINNNSGDNCPGNLQFALNPSTFDCSDADGTTQHVVTLTVTDAAGNTAACVSHVVVHDLVSPIFTFCPPNRTVACTANTSPSSLGAAIASDNCNTSLTVVMTESAPVFVQGSSSFVRTWTATDLNGNTAVCNQTITLTDNATPTLSAQPANVSADCPSSVPPVPSITATDNCDNDVPVTVALDTTFNGTGACRKFDFVARRTWKAKDDAGNETVHTQTITIKDDKKPEFILLPDTLKFFSANSPAVAGCVVPVNFNIFQYLTDCAPDSTLTVSVTGAPFGAGAANINGNWTTGTRTLVFTATDPCGNSKKDTCVFVTIDNSVPTAICNDNVVISLGSQGTATLSPNDINLGSTDNCQIASMTLSQTQFDCGDLGTVPVTLTVTDNSGNSNTCTVDVEVSVGSATVFNLTTASTAASYFGNDDGTATATATGGSGNFSYLWDNGETTSTITGLTAGTYFVTVTDDNTGCQRTMEVEVEEGEKIKITVGTVSGTQGSMALIPVTVQQFNDVVGFSFTLHVEDDQVAELVDIQNVNTAIDDPNAQDFTVQFNGNDVSIFWVNAQQNPVTLPLNELLFNIKVNLVGPVNTQTPVTIDGTPVDLEFNQLLQGNATVVPVEVINGLAQITSNINTVDVGGDIYAWANPEIPTSVERPVNNVLVNLGGLGQTPQTMTTGTDGKYDFTVPSASNTDVTCSKTTAGNNGITSGDLLRIVNHIFGDAFSSPYQWVAADVNSSGTVTLADYLRIQRVVLGTDQHIQGSPDWKFIPKSYVFPIPPIATAPDENIEHTPALQDWLDDDFVAVRMGDVNGNGPVSLVSADDRSGEAKLFNVEDREFREGETFTVPFKAGDFRNRNTYQFTLAFDPSALSLEDIQTGVLPNLKVENFGTAQLENGFLTTVWVNREAVSLNPNDVIFTLTFRALKSKNALSGVLRSGSDITKAETYDASGNVQSVDIEYITPIKIGGTDAEFALFQNQPNPFRGETSIAFRLPNESRANLRVFNASGQLVKLVVGNFEKGTNVVSIKNGDLGTPGVYWYELETPDFSDRKKMILID